MKSILTTLTTVLRFEVLAVMHFFVKEFIGNLSHSIHLHTLPIPPAGSRILLFIPHPDDEIAACCTFISKAIKTGCFLKTVMITNGDGVGLADYIKYKLTKPKPKYFEKMAYIRQKETKAALTSLGLTEDNIIFLGYPDRCSLNLWRNNWDPDKPFTSPYTKCNRSPYTNSYKIGAAYTGSSLVNDIEEITKKFNPTHIIYPHFYDCHVDHFSANNFVKYIIAKTGIAAVELTYLVHRGHWPTPPGRFKTLGLTPPRSLDGCGIEWFSLPLSANDIREKGKRLHFYKSQSIINRVYLLSFLRKNELFGQYRDIDVYVNEIMQNGAETIHIDNPCSDTIRGYLHKSADISGLTITIRRDSMECTMGTVNRPGKNYQYIFDLIFFEVNKTIKRCVISIDNGILRSNKATMDCIDSLDRQIVYSIGDYYVKITLCCQDLNNINAIFVNAVTRMGDILIDRTGSRLIKLRH